MDTMPPVYKTGPTHPEIRVELGKPIVLPVTAGEPQGTLSARWVKECGESECLSVTGGIRAATSPDTKVGRFPHGHLWRDNHD